MTRKVILILCLCAFLPLTMVFTRPVVAFIGNLTPTPEMGFQPGEDDIAAVRQAVLQGVDERQEVVLAFLINQVIIDNIRFSEDGTWAAAWLGLMDTEVGIILPSEPGLALVVRDGNGWQVTLQSDATWIDTLQAAPESLITPQEKEFRLLEYQNALNALPAAPLTGYKLPWAAGETRYLSRSVGHDATYPSGRLHFSFDFYVYDTMWRIYAAKAGTVWSFKTDVPTCYEYHCDQSVGNYMVILDPTTSPATYMVYLHLAEDSIPAELRVRGAPVQQGQFIGIADNTGASWGDHLHFQVHTNPDYWGTSVDVVFTEVSINGGRPRSYTYDHKYCLPTDVCNSFQNAYISANVIRDDISAPTGSIASPDTGDIFNQTSRVLLAGYGQDSQSGMSSGRFVAFYNNTWNNVGPLISGDTYVYNWDMCAENVPSGPVSLALRLTDRVGNVNMMAGLTHVTKNFTCSPPPPACQPASNQVALYKDADYLGGCVLYNVGEYPTAELIGDNNAASLLVGSSVMVTLFSETNLSGRAETFTANDSNLADNAIGADSASSLDVKLRTTRPKTPVAVWPAAGYTATFTQSVGLAWYDGGGATSFQLQLQGPGGTQVYQVQQPWIQLGSLAPGSYNWTVKGVNSAGLSTAATSPRSFTIISTSQTLPAPVGLPYTNGAEIASSIWQTSGLWHREDGPSPIPAHSGSYYYWFGTQVSGDEYYYNGKLGDLTSPPILLDTANPQLSFWYRYQTESSQSHWDQRWVQLSVNGGPFTNVLQLSGDPMNIWLPSPVIDLSSYSGQVVQVRFHFDVIDPSLIERGGHNDYEGWYIDDIEIAGGPPLTCLLTGEPNNSPASATSLSFNQTVTGEICPYGDLDYFVFSGQAGDQIVADVDAQVLSSTLDSLLFLLDSDGASVLAENDDEINQNQVDSLLAYRLLRSGSYFLRLQAWDHPGAAGNTHTYSLRLTKDTLPPQLQVLSPSSNSYLPNSPMTISAQSNDAVSVEFWWHNSDWQTGKWVLLNTDSNAADGWSYTFANPGEQSDAAVFVRAYDRAGNSTGSGIWNLVIDSTPPTTALAALDPIQRSTAFQLTWTAFDARAGIGYFDVQQNENSTGWTELASGLPANQSGLWVIGQPGSIYDYRMRGVDRVGNAEPFPASAETTTFITSTLCATFDEWENDNQWAAATPISTDGMVQTHSFCNPQAGSLGLADEDWITFSVIANDRYVIHAQPRNPAAAANMELYTRNGSTLTQVKTATASYFGEWTTLEWFAPADGTVYVRIRHLDSRVAGEPVVYSVWVEWGYSIHMPYIGR